MSSELRVMSYNIRYGTADDVEHDWSSRRELIVRVIKRFAPDVLGTQEALDFQVQHLARVFPQYAYVGAGREDGQLRGEQVAVYFRRDRFELLDSGHVWLSKTPEVAGSRSWDSRLPRMVTWCRLADSRGPVDELYLLNTHFDMRGEVARFESAKLLRKHLEARGLDRPLVVTGDFNCSEDELPYQILMTGGTEAGLSVDMVDSYRAAHPSRRADESTRHDFSFRRQGPRIDWIIHSRRFATVEASIDRRQVNGRFASDHHPITAVLRSS